MTHQTIKVHSFYRRYNLRLHEIPKGVKCPIVVGWTNTDYKADAVEQKLIGKFNKYGWLLDDNHLVIDIDLHNAEENGLESLEKFQSAIGIDLDEVCKAIVYSPSGGRHYYFRKPPEYKFGKTFKALYPGIDFISGHGKQVIAANSYHDKYEGTYQLSEDAELVDLPQPVLDYLFQLSEKKQVQPVVVGDGDRSGDEFNKSQRGLSFMVSALQAFGYTVRRVGDYFEFDRPNKSTDSKCSGHVGKQSKQGNYQLTYFSLSGDHFPSGESLSLFHAYALLAHNGNHSQAADALYRFGFAEKHVNDFADFMPDDKPEPSKDDPKPDPDKNTKSAAELLTSYLDKLRNKTVPQLYKLGPALDGIEVGPELLCCIGAPPSVGKTALAMQVVYEVLEHSPETRVVIANAETSPDGLFARQLSAVTRIDSSKIRFADLTQEELEQVAEAIGKMSQHMQTVEFMLDPGLEGVIDLLNSKPGLLVCDYLQKFSPGDKDPRIGVNLVVGWLRKLCLKGWAVLALSATKRDSKGKHSADELGMSSFRESGDIEFNLDSAYVLKNNGPIDDQVWLRHVTLKCEKNRNGPKQDFELRFHMPQMSFDCYDPVNLDEFNAWSGSAFGGDDDE